MGAQKGNHMQMLMRWFSTALLTLLGLTVAGYANTDTGLGLGQTTDEVVMEWEQSVFKTVFPPTLARVGQNLTKTTEFIDENGLGSKWTIINPVFAGGKIMGFPDQHHLVTGTPIVTTKAVTETYVPLDNGCDSTQHSTEYDGVTNYDGESGGEDTGTDFSTDTEVMMGAQTSPFYGTGTFDINVTWTARLDTNGGSSSGSLSIDWSASAWHLTMTFVDITAQTWTVTQSRTVIQSSTVTIPQSSQPLSTVTVSLSGRTDLTTGWETTVTFCHWADFWQDMELSFTASLL